MGRNREVREQQLLKCIPDVLDYKTLLYIGAKKKMRQMLNLFINTSYVIDILEIWPPNVVGLKDLEGIRNIIEGDIRDILSMKLDSYDVVMWWHGPEHVYWWELGQVLKNSKSLAKKLAVVACPLGVSPQGSKKGNVHERHVALIYPETFKKLGWETDVINHLGNPGNNLLAWNRR